MFLHQRPMNSSSAACSILAYHLLICISLSLVIWTINNSHTDAHACLHPYASKQCWVCQVLFIHRCVSYLSLSDYQCRCRQGELDLCFQKQRHGIDRSDTVDRQAANANREIFHELITSIERIAKVSSSALMLDFWADMRINNHIATKDGGKEQIDVDPYFSTHFPSPISFAEGNALCSKDIWVGKVTSTEHVQWISASCSTLLFNKTLDRLSERGTDRHSFWPISTDPNGYRSSKGVEEGVAVNRHQHCFLGRYNFLSGIVPHGWFDVRSTGKASSFSSLHRWDASLTLTFSLGVREEMTVSLHGFISKCSEDVGECCALTCRKSREDKRHSSPSLLSNLALDPREQHEVDLFSIR